MESLHTEQIQAELSQISSLENQRLGIALMVGINLAAFLIKYIGPDAIDQLTNWISQ